MKEPVFIHLDEVTSTNFYLRSLSNIMTLENGYTVYANFQSAGRGQRGNFWESAKGENLMFSTILYPVGLRADRPFIVSQIISLAIKDVLERYTSDISIKWSNDIYWKEKKITGILIENDIMGDEVDKIIIGVGINLNQETFITNAPNPVSLKQITGNSYNVKDILTQVIEQMLFYYEKLQDTELIKFQYKQSLFRKKGFHLFADEKETFLAEIYDIEDSGLLVLKLESGQIRKFGFKEIKYIL